MRSCDGSLAIGRRCDECVLDGDGGAAAGIAGDVKFGVDQSGTGAEVVESGALVVRDGGVETDAVVADPEREGGVVMAERDGDPLSRARRCKCARFLAFRQGPRL